MSGNGESYWGPEGWGKCYDLQNIWLINLVINSGKEDDGACFSVLASSSLVQSYKLRVRIWRLL